METNDKAGNELPKGWRKVENNEVLPKGTTVKIIFGNIKITDAPTKEETFNEKVARLDNLINPNAKQDVTKEVNRRTLSQNKTPKTLKEKIVMVITYVVIIGIIIALVKFCHNSNSDQQTAPEGATPRNINDSLKLERTLSAIAVKYHALKSLKDYHYTFQYRQLLDSNNRVIIDSFEVTDINREDSTYLISLTGDENNIHYQLSCNKSQLNTLLTDSDIIEYDWTLKKSIFIVAAVYNIKKFNLDVSVENDVPADEDNYVSIHSYDAPFMASGKIIDIVKP